MLVVFAFIVGVVHWTGRSEVDEAMRAAQAQREAFAVMRLPQAIERCRALMGPRREAERPVAVAWQPGRLDWYELRDFDRRVMRLFSCDGAQVREGAGVQRVWAEHLPQADDGDEAQTDLFQQLQLEPADGVQALEAALGPYPGADPAWVQRRWMSGAAQPAHPLVDELPRLFASQPPGLPAAPLLPPLPAINWAKDSQAAFDQLARHVPANARVVRVEIGPQRLHVTIAGPLPGDELGKMSPYGALSFDEFGASNAPSWRAQDGVHGACTIGRPLPEVRDAFRAVWPSDTSRVEGARFGCGRDVDLSDDQEPGGKWRILREPRRRAAQR